MTTARRLLPGLALACGLAGCVSPKGWDGPDSAPPAEFAAKTPGPRAAARGQVGELTNVSWAKPGDKAQPSAPAQPLAASPAAPPADIPVQPVAAVQPTPLPQPKPVQPKAPPLDVPAGLPGASAPLPVLPPDTPDTRAARLKAIEELFPVLPPLGPDPLVDGAPGSRAVTVEELIEFARRNSPVIALAAADVENYRGQWVQAGLYPNPTVGYQGDQVGNLNSAGQQGGFFEQPVVLSNRLKLARSVSYFDYLNAKLRLRRAEVDLARQVRADYYAALVAAENVRVSRLVAAFTEDVYARQVAMVRAGSAAAFEANALRAVVGQVRLTVVQSRNRYTSAWRQLAATLNAPEMPPAPLAGRPDVPAPHYNYDLLAARLTQSHTDIAAARNSITQAARTLNLEQIRPIPDLQNHFYFQDDTQANSFQVGIQLGATIPVFNRNQGAILSAKALLLRATRDVERVRNDLLRQLADAYERYEVARQQADLYREQILPDLVRAFRGVYARYQVEPGVVNYNDIVTAQQNLAGQLNNYLTVLNQQWQAAADVAGLVQVLDPAELLVEPADPAVPETWPEYGPRPVVPSVQPKP